MLIKVKCPQAECGHEYMIDDTLVGRKVRCRHCREKFIVPAVAADGPQTEAEPEPAQPSSPPSEATPPPASDEAPGSSPPRIGRYEIQAVLGSGRFGAVYRAYDPVLQRDVALKVPRSTTLEKPKARARFLRESKAAASLRHPAIVPVYDAGQHGNSFFIAAAFIEGQTLKDIIAAARPDFRTAAEIVRQLAEGLHYAHSMGIVHRDVKPSNVMVDAAGRPHVMDFGLAHVENADVKLTADGAVLGTPAYISPEQADRAFGEVGPASDQYSLGVLLYELLCGERPFTGSLADIFLQLLTEPPEPPRRRNPQVPRDLEAICLKAMAKQPGDRYADCGALADDLARWLSGQPVVARRMDLAERGQRWVRHDPLAMATLAGVVLMFAVALLIVTWQWRHAAGQLEETRRELREAELRIERLESSGGGTVE